jgi:hypothetical protein
MLLGVSDLYIYKSYVLNKNATNLSVNLTNLVIPNTLFKLSIKINSIEIIARLNETIKQMEKRIVEFNNNIKSLEVSSRIKQTKKTRTKPSIVITDLSDKTKKSIEKFKILILESEKEILTLKSNISTIEIYLSNLVNLKDNEIKDIYMKHFHNTSVFLNYKKIIKEFNKNIIIPTSNLSISSHLNSNSSTIR